VGRFEGTIVWVTGGGSGIGEAAALTLAGEGAAIVLTGRREAPLDDVARRIRAHDWGRRIRLVALSGWGQEDDRRRAREAGFDDHLVKPVAPEVLRSLLASIGSGNGVAKPQT